MFKCDNCKRHGLILVKRRQSQDDVMEPLTPEELKRAFNDPYSISTEWVCVKCGERRVNA